VVNYWTIGTNLARASWPGAASVGRVAGFALPSGSGAAADAAPSVEAPLASFLDSPGRYLPVAVSTAASFKTYCPQSMSWAPRRYCLIDERAERIV